MSLKFDQFGRIGVLMGGYSSEREISLKSGTTIYNAINSLGLNVVALDITVKEHNQIIDFIKAANIDLAFIALHGKLGEDGVIQQMLEDLSIAYVGSGPEASRLALDKIQAQEIFRTHDVNVPKSVVIKKHNYDDIDAIIEKISFENLVVKPSTEGSSIGMTFVNDKKNIKEAISKALSLSDEVLIEEFIKGREFTVGILDTEPLSVIEIKPKDGIFDYTAKYNKGLTEYVVPAKIPPIVSSTLQSVALKCHRLLKCRDMSRVDFILRESDLAYFVLEVNTIPGFTATSLLPMAAKHIGYSIEELCLKLLRLGYGKKKENNN